MEEHRLSFLQNRLLKTILGAKKGEIIGGRRKLHNEELHNLFSIKDKTRVNKSKRMARRGV
jgi:hypothetical protein